MVVLDASTPRVVRDGERGRVEIVGAPLLTKKPNEDLVAKTIAECAQRDDQGADIRVLVGHGNVSSFGDVFDLSQIDVAAAERACADGVIDYVALGDTHSAMKLGEAIYKASQDAEDSAEASDEARPVDDDIVDADFEDLGEKKRK